MAGLGPAHRLTIGAQDTILPPVRLQARQNGKGPFPSERSRPYFMNFQKRNSTPAANPAPALYSWFLR